MAAVPEGLFQILAGAAGDLGVARRGGGLGQSEQGLVALRRASVPGQGR